MDGVILGIAIMLLPLMAIVLALLYLLSGRRYVEHLILLAHFHSFVFLLVGCGSDSPSNPTAPETEASAATVVFAGSASLDPYRSRIDALLQDAARRAGQRISVGAITFTVSDDGGRSIPGWGIGGYTFGPNEIEIVVDQLGDIGDVNEVVIADAAARVVVAAVVLAEAVAAGVAEALGAAEAAAAFVAAGATLGADAAVVGAQADGGVGGVAVGAPLVAPHV